MTTPNPSTFSGGLLQLRAGGVHGQPDPGRFWLETPAAPRPPQPRGAHPAESGVPGKRLGGGRARHPRGSGAARPCERGVCAMRSLLLAPTPRLRARAAPAGLPRPARGGHSPSPAPRGGRAAAPAPLPPAGTGRPRPRALPPRSGSVGAGQGLGTAGYGAPFVERLNSPLIQPPPPAGHYARSSASPP